MHLFYRSVFLFLLLTSGGFFLGTPQAICQVVVESRVDSTVNNYKSFLRSGYAQFFGGEIVEIKASSSQETEGRYNYEATNLIKNNFAAVWMEGVEGYGIGESLQLTFTKLTTDDKRTFNKQFYCVNGYAFNPSVWSDYARVKAFKVYKTTAPDEQEIVMLADSPFLQTFELSFTLQEGDILVFEILDVYVGNKYDDTCLSMLAPVCLP
ncbi:MAG TPA: hypothetical protein DCM08_06755 [Microscillaceae bacterium]|jgi:hypothetical protein|nr:hypothetical protein [Microscillaceae bacterium]